MKRKLTLLAVTVVLGLTACTKKCTQCTYTPTGGTAITSEKFCGSNVEKQNFNQQWMDKAQTFGGRTVCKGVD